MRIRGKGRVRLEGIVRERGGKWVGKVLWRRPRIGKGIWRNSNEVDRKIWREEEGGVGESERGQNRGDG